MIKALLAAITQTIMLDGGSSPPLFSFDLTSSGTYPLGEMSSASFDALVGGGSTFSNAEGGTSRSLVQLSNVSQPLVTGRGAGALIMDAGSAGLRGLGIFRSITNKLFHSNDFSTGWSGAAGSTVVSGQPGPDGSSSSASHVSCTSGGTGGGYQHFIFPGATPKTCIVGSCFMKQNAGGDLYQVSIGTGFDKSMGGSTPAAWTWVQLTLDEGAPVANDCYWGPCDGTLGANGTGIAAGARSEIIAYNQLETGGGATPPYGPCVGSYLTRAPDIFSFNIAAKRAASGALRLRLAFVAFTASVHEASDKVLWYVNASNWVIWRVIGSILQACVAGTIVTYGSIVWNQFDLVEVWLPTGGSVSEPMWYRTNGGNPIVIDDGNAPALGAWPSSGTLYIGSDGTNTSLDGLLQSGDFYA